MAADQTSAFAGTATAAAEPPRLPPAAPLRDQMLRRLRAIGDGVALRVRQTPDEPWRNLIRRMLEEATARGGELAEYGASDFVLLGVPRAIAERTADRIDAIGALPPVERVALPAGMEAVLGWVAPPVPPPATGAADPGAIDTLLAAASPASLVVPLAVRRIADAGERTVAIRLAIAPDRFARMLGALADDRDLVAHAADWVAAWTMADPAAAAGETPLPVLVPLPRTGMPADAGGAPWVGLLPLPAAADPAALAARRSALAARGWGLALGPIDAAALPVVAPQHLAADLLLLRWSPTLAAAHCGASLRAFDTRQVILDGCDHPDAIAWGRSVGIARFAGMAAGP